MPADQAAFEQESLAEKNDVSLVALLGSLNKSIKDTREMGRKFGLVDQTRQQSSKKGYGIGNLTDEFFPSAGGHMGRPLMAGEGDWM